MTDTEIISATEASRAFSDLLHRVCYGGESFIIKKGNRLMARITPVVVEAGITQVAQEVQPAASEQLPLPKTTEKMVSEEVTEGTVEYFKTVIAQLRQSALEPCE